MATKEFFFRSIMIEMFTDKFVQVPNVCALSVICEYTYHIERAIFAFTVSLKEDTGIKQVSRPTYEKLLVCWSLSIVTELQLLEPTLLINYRIAFNVGYIILFYQLYLETKLALYEEKIFTFTMSITVTNKLYTLHNRAFTYSSPESILQNSKPHIRSKETMKQMK